MTKSEYRKYLKSPHWLETREAAKERANHFCEECFSTQRLEVHHLTYKNLGREEPNDLKVLCRDCHQAAHDKVEIPCLPVLGFLLLVFLCFVISL
jgi:5-methylcytosine-specific restriction endonuclease McrA